MKKLLKVVDGSITQQESATALAAAIFGKLTYVVGTTQDAATPRDWFFATALALRDRIVDEWVDTGRRARGQKRVYYLSIEYLPGRLLYDAMSNMKLVHPMCEALATFGIDLSELRALEPDPALGSGGLGRLAACFMDSMATLGIPAYGYGIRYEHGLFRQQIREGKQEETADDWLKSGNPWEIEHQPAALPVRFGGTGDPVEEPTSSQGAWIPDQTISAVPYDTPVVGWGGQHVNTLRLWSARAPEPIDIHTFSRGEYVGALAAHTRTEAISGMLYPNANYTIGQELRLRQEYFFTSASLQDIVRRHLTEHPSVMSLPENVTIQMNDTHPALAVAELMRILVDEHNVAWKEAWKITTAVLNYTNHTLMPEALETWPVDLMTKLLPRHMQIIFRINMQHLNEVVRSGGDLASLSIIDETGERQVRMGHLAFIGSRRINGVSALHTRIMRETIFKDLDRCYPHRIVNKTNGIALRRWLFEANPRLTKFLVDAIGERLLGDPDELRKLEPLAEDKEVHRQLRAIRGYNKQALGSIIEKQTGLRPDPAAMFDVHIKRIHEYKRQLLNIIEAVALYHDIRANPNGEWAPRVKIFAGKAAMNYVQAKLIIQLINDVAKVINADPIVGNRLKVVFLANYSVSLAEAIIPAADLSEQISTAGLEASGTGNMKLAVNGALTIGTLDGANIEILENVGNENIFIFGLKSDEVLDRRHAGYMGRDAVESSPQLANAITSIAEGQFSPEERNRYAPLIDRILGADEYMVAADFQSYWQMQRRIDQTWGNQTEWWRASILNTARTSWFSADRAIREYADEIWRVPVASHKLQ